MTDTGSQPQNSRAVELGTRATVAFTTSSSSYTRWMGGGRVVELPYMPPVDPTTVIMDRPFVPEVKRFCSKCGAQVGRSRDESPGRVTGFCSRCRTPYSFIPALATGDLLANQYRILGCITFGGMGWIHLAQDERVSKRWVVLKGLLSSSDEGAQAAAMAERQFLARVEHPNVVRIYNVVEHTSGVYIVMEYVGGKTLRNELRDRRRDGRGPLPVDLAIAYILAVLPAFGYLHELGLIYNDFKPDNLMLQGSDVKLIDLGAVTRIGDSSPVLFGTDGYQAPELNARAPNAGPSVAGDLYTIGRTLALLVIDLPTFQTEYRHRLPTPDREPLFRRYESLYRFLLKATAHAPRDRYQTADEMGEALDAVLREVAAMGQGGARPAPSRLFASTVLAQYRGDGASPDWRHLPPPRVNVNDPAATQVADVMALEPEARVRAIREALAEGRFGATVEVQLALAGALIELGRHSEVEAILSQLEALDRREWRGHWYRGLSLLAQGRPAEAGLAFDLVFVEVPGELAPRLALALAAEQTGDLDTASRHYDTVSATDPGFTSASLGLARVRQAQGEAAGAVEAYERIPATSSLYTQAQMALARVLIQGGREAPTVEDLVRASSVIEALPLSDVQRAGLAVGLFEAVLDRLAARTLAPRPDVRLLGQPLREVPVRLGLERAYRELAYAAEGEERMHLVECANEVRPVTAS